MIEKFYLEPLKSVLVSSIYHYFNLFLETCNDEVILSFSDNSGHILAPKFDTVSFPNNFVLMFLEAR